jgi:glycosyltransferase involved in cell wall biosynthesis
VHIVIITDKVPPINCGIGDHTLHLSKALRKYGFKVTIIARQGFPTKYVKILNEQSNSFFLELAKKKLLKLKPNFLILQFTPLMYDAFEANNTNKILSMWNAISSEYLSGIIVHETYFFAWWYPPSWINGIRQKNYLKKMIMPSAFVYTASKPLAIEITNWKINNSINWLPISSNFPDISIPREILRDKMGLSKDEILLVLFGGGNSLKWLSSHVNLADQFLFEAGIKVKWLLLGGASNDWFHLKAPIISPGFLPPSKISELLVASDIFLMPHYAGVSAKRGTLLAAMQSGLPVIGTRTFMTDDFLYKMKGIVLFSIFQRNLFAMEVLKLAKNKAKRKILGNLNRQFFATNLTWDLIAKTIIDNISD